ncbi:16S rRNA (guanine(966)-N(2))-methyltransferase RsmD [Demequina lignilytica]|uniref:16S rRNA (Guanine(966)-N(2))-methyltransferase RsmD n=1 Tax=Demequina lignilytica TaxID=3051663 RepID=A0AB35MFF6_9MICO|nr:16S rRNA (guanine(966)-N(2))-methyltransferase RsmD [Demequina sp. SYSU T0a273]MDN4482485.1 16S rRNA (guanine(966)-N(2))-methyltransferase RsmD [Demequina sp. SYSU T0a273]
MTRIIAGRWGGRRLAVPPRGTRPTTDRVREAVFSRLDHGDHLRGARVLDLFAGSGALAFEALSRGASEATLVESDARAVSVLRANARDLAAGPDARVVKERVRPFLGRAAGPWDVVLLDPPYDIARDELAAVLEGVAEAVDADGIVVLEWSTRAGDAPWPWALEEVAAKAYGETTVRYAVPRAGGPDVSTGGGSVEA